MSYKYKKSKKTDLISITKVIIKKNTVCINEALALIQSIDFLKNKYFIKAGAGQRYLKYTQPNALLLQHAEKRVQYDHSKLSKKHNKNKGTRATIMSAMNRSGMV